MNFLTRDTDLDQEFHYLLLLISVKIFFGKHSHQWLLKHNKELKLKEPSSPYSIYLLQDLIKFKLCNRHSIDKDIQILIIYWPLFWSFSSLFTSKDSESTSQWNIKRLLVINQPTQLNYSIPQISQLFYKLLWFQTYTFSPNYCTRDSEETY